MTPIRAAIVDDEPLAREALRELLEDSEGVGIVGEYRNGASFLAELPRLHPDVVFLDVEMPRLTGFDLATEIRAATPVSPFVVFVTAFDRYAVRAFEAAATDYLLKPLDADRLAMTIERIRQGLLAPYVDAPLPLPPAPPPGEWLTRIGIKERDHRTLVLRVQDIDWVEAAGNYVRAHAGGKSYLFRATLSGMEAGLDPSVFVRIHRATIVNIERVAEIQASFRQEHLVTLRDGTRLCLGAPYRARLRQLIGGF
jgi:two-component system LytT family response regulator